MLRACAAALFTLSAGLTPAMAADSPYPSDDEVLILELMNRFRADPSAEADRILAEGKAHVYGEIDWSMFESEVKALQPSPPVVFNLELLQAARLHADYQIQNGILTHVQDPGKPGFTGKSFSDRAKAAGYRGGPSGENCFKDARGPWASSVGFIVDFGKGGPGGMQPERGHRRNMHAPGNREVGVSANPHGGSIAVVHVFGSGKGHARYAGGVIYIDKDGNDFYSPGEGLGGVTVSTADGSATTTTWPSGAYTLPLDSKDAVTLIAERDGLRFEQRYEAGGNNLKFDWVVPPKADLDRADSLIAAVSGMDADDRKRFPSLVDLHLAAQRLHLDPARSQAINDLVGSIGSDLDAAQSAVLAAIDTNDADSLRTLLREHGRTYRRTGAEAWFDQAGTVFEASAAVAGLEAQAGRPDRRFGKRDVERLIASLDDSAATFAPDLAQRMAELAARAKAVPLD